MQWREQFYTKNSNNFFEIISQIVNQLLAITFGHFWYLFLWHDCCSAVFLPSLRVSPWKLDWLVPTVSSLLSSLSTAWRWPGRSQVETNFLLLLLLLLARSNTNAALQSGLAVGRGKFLLTWHQIDSYFIPYLFSGAWPTNDRCLGRLKLGWNLW